MALVEACYVKVETEQLSMTVIDYAQIQMM